MRTRLIIFFLLLCVLVSASLFIRKTYRWDAFNQVTVASSEREVFVFVDSTRVYRNLSIAQLVVWRLGLSQTVGETTLLNELRTYHFTSSGLTRVKHCMPDRVFGPTAPIEGTLHLFLGGSDTSVYRWINEDFIRLNTNEVNALGATVYATERYALEGWMRLELRDTGRAQPPIAFTLGGSTGTISFSKATAGLSAAKLGIRYGAKCSIDLVFDQAEVPESNAAFAALQTLPKGVLFKCDDGGGHPLQAGNQR